MVCSFAPTLLNRRSKYWQENWEIKVEESELKTIGKFFAKEEPTQSYKGPGLNVPREHRVRRRQHQLQIVHRTTKPIVDRHDDFTAP
jgi:hypothetical protein